MMNGQVRRWGRDVFNLKNELTKVEITSTGTDKQLVSSGTISPPVTDDSLIKNVMLILNMTLHNTYAGANNLAGGTIQFQNAGGGYQTLYTIASGDANIDVEDGTLSLPPLIFDITSHVTDIDGNMDVKIASAQAAQNNMELFYGLALTVSWKAP